MRKTVFLLASLFVMACGIQSVKAQTASASASASANATIITPIAIAHVEHLNFGNIVAGTGIGTVIVDTEGDRTKTGDVILPTTGTFNAAEFTVTGLANATYAITLPESINISTTGGETMTVDNFTSNPSGTGTLAANGEQTLSVGARLIVGAGQVAGDYTGEFSVTVAYN